MVFNSFLDVIKDQRTRLATAGSACFLIHIIIARQGIDLPAVDAKLGLKKHNKNGCLFYLFDE